MDVNLGWLLITCLMYLVASILVLWIAGAIFFDVGRATWFGGVLAAIWVVCAIVAFLSWQPAWKPFVLILVLSGFFLRWWFFQKPSQHREWDPNFSQLARVSLQGDEITVENVRNTEYRSARDFDTRFETRSYRLSQLIGVDAILLQWGSTLMCHPMFVFDFGSSGRLCISIEVRYRVGQKYSLIRSLYRQQELMYVVSDERDAILRRSKCLEGHDLYLYRLASDALTDHEFFFEYVNAINSLAENPRWYHGLTTNCTTSIYAQGRGRMEWDWRMLFNGSLDRFMYDRQLLDQELPFESLKKQSWINGIANSAPVDNFGDYLRRELTGYRTSVDHELAETGKREEYLT
ncbi:lipoprotein N-acyltransferase Lnb domain-containing protein [Bythopirellula goksoeyrii]|uniref:Lnb N-terminal periplasmic domain-containing protein n=1 Tax=Bythopirellula goksoeyrii TaxID=1400387 RepID=A0A5B9QHV8_9BACT|nr:DUF4105 domain-containing protein [Bythopirellula goksoeyrii]QEG37539.1 hypothetical protein Pr1d_48850 [Bythopirellula goksoeyrii]